MSATQQEQQAEQEVMNTNNSNKNNTDTDTDTTIHPPITIHTPDPKSSIELNEINDTVILGRGKYGIPRNDNKLSRHHATLHYNTQTHVLELQVSSLNPLYISTDD